MGSNNVKHFYYAAIFYNENLTEQELYSVLSSCPIPCIVSPLHNRDIISQKDYDKYLEYQLFEDINIGDTKKPHWHVIFQMPYAKQPKSSLIYINDNLPSTLQLKYVEGIGFLNLYTRYLCHLDNPEKYQYDTKKIKVFKDFPFDLTKPTPPRSARCVRTELQNFILTCPNCTINNLLIQFKDDDLICSYIERHTYLVSVLIKEKYNPDLYRGDLYQV